jgi:hypothetical protein
MPEHLSPLDAMFLEFEQADESAQMHIGAVMVFDPVADGRNPTLADLCERLEDRLASLPRFRERLSSTRRAACPGRRGSLTPALTSVITCATTCCPRVCFEAGRAALLLVDREAAVAEDGTIC